MGISGATTVVGVMGDPISHSLSPLIHNAGFRHLKLDWVCVAFPATRGSAEQAVRGMAALGVVGMSVTMPHKQAVIGSLDQLSDDARLLDAVNCIALRDGELVGLNTDGDGFVAGLLQDFSIGPRGMNCAVLGAGGAARSVILALARHGAKSIAVINRTQSSAEFAAGLVEQAHVGGGDDVDSADLVVNATSLGMVATGGSELHREHAGAAERPTLPCDPELLGPDQFVVDLVYNPLQTDWLVAAARQGATTANGISMLVNQAAVAFETWTGESAPVEVMAATVRAHLSDSHD